MSDSSTLTVLLERIAQRDESAFEDLHRRTSRLLMAIARSTVYDRARAEDALQEAYLSIWRYAASFNPSVAKPMTWMITIVRNKARDALRMSMHQSALQAAWADEHDAIEKGEDEEAAGHSSASSRVLKNELDACIAGLQAGPRQALALAYYRSMAHGEIAENLGVPLGTAKAWIRRGLGRLRVGLAARHVAKLHD